MKGLLRDSIHNLASDHFVVTAQDEGGRCMGCKVGIFPAIGSGGSKSNNTLVLLWL